MSNGVTQEGRDAGGWKSLCKLQEGCVGKSAYLTSSSDTEGNFSTEGLVLTLPRKASSQVMVPVPQTDTGRREEYSKARGRTLVKELGKMTP